MQLIQKQNDLALRVGHFLENRLQALLELAPELCPGDHRAHIQRDNALVLQAFWYIAIDNALAQPFDNGRLADACLADEHRVILGTATQHLNDTANLFVASDDRIEFALSRNGSQVTPVLFERLKSAFGVLRRYALPTAHGHQRLKHRIVVNSQAAKNITDQFIIGQR